MIDMLVRLYDLPEMETTYQKVAGEGIILRRPGVYEKHLVAKWVGEHFSPKWVSEVEVAMAHQPATCFIATKDKEILGFACYDTTCKGYFGPTGVGEAARGKGVGKGPSLQGTRGLARPGLCLRIYRWCGASRVLSESLWSGRNRRK